MMMVGNKLRSHKLKKQKELQPNRVDYSAMATTRYSFSLLQKSLQCSSLLFIILVSCLVKKSCAFHVRRDDTEAGSHFQSVEISSLFPASVCKGTNKRESTLEVVHRHGPCGRDEAAAADATPSLAEILSHEQSRADSIRARLNPNSTTDKVEETNSNGNRLRDKKANLPVQSGRSLGSGNYIVTVGLGTPKKTLSLVFDTGSDLTWTQCQPCVRSCYKQNEPIFDPTISSSYSNVSCSSTQCSQLSAATGNTPGCASSTCVYGIQYGDQSFSVGFFSRETLTLTSTDVFPNFLFGCGQNNQGLFGRTAGLLGLGRNTLSIVSQTAQKYGKYFSYCLPSTSSSTGHLTLGKSGSSISRNVKFTPLDTSKGTAFYFISILSISVGGSPLPIGQSVFKTSGSIIDSGTVITRLPPTTYSALSSAFKKLMAKYPKAPAFSILDTCYDLSGLTTITIPKISFTLSGNVKVDLAPSGIIVAVASSRVCLAFTANNDDTDVAIFGNTQQKTLEVVYDVAGGKLGFGPAACK